MLWWNENTPHCTHCTHCTKLYKTRSIEIELHVLVFETYTYYMYTVRVVQLPPFLLYTQFKSLLFTDLYTHSLPRSSWSYSVCPGTEPGRSRGQVWVSRGHQCPGYDHPHHSPVHHHSVWRLHSTYTKGGAVCTCTN